MQLQGNGLVQLGKVLKLTEQAKLRLEAPEPGLHEAVLPRTSFVGGAELDFVALARLLVQQAQVFAALVRVQDGWGWVFGESV